MSRSVAIIGTRGYPSFYGGFESAVRKLSPYLANQGWKVAVYGRPDGVVADARESHEEIESRITFGVDTKSLSTLSYGLTATLHTVWKRPDVALVMNVANGFWLPLLKWRGIPTVVNVDGIEWEREKWGRFARFIFRMGARATARFGDELVFDARAIERYWHEHFQRDGTFIPYGGEIPLSLLPVEAGLESRAYVLMVARFVPENTVEEFVLAAEQLSLNHPVVIVGSSGHGGEMEARVRHLADTYENVRWLGHLNDDARLFSLWQHAGVYFHGHSVGGTNPALVQAMACGAPVLARDTPYNREVLSDCAEFVRPRADAITFAASQLLEDPVLQNQLGQRAQRRAATNYDWAMVNRDYEFLLSKTALGQ